MDVYWSRFVDLADKMALLIGERLGGGNTFRWLGVNERRLRIDVVYGDRYMLGDADIGTIGDNGNNGEFGVCTLRYIDIFPLLLFHQWKRLRTKYFALVTRVARPIIPTMEKYPIMHRLFIKYNNFQEKEPKNGLVAIPNL